MKGKGFIKFLAIVLGLISIIEIFPTFYVNQIERKAKAQSNGTEADINKQIKKLAEDTLNLGVTKLNYYDAKKQEINLGLDLKGGINVMLEISEKDLLLDLADNSDNPVFRKALADASEAMKSSRASYTSNFFTAFEKDKQELGQANLRLSSPEVFGTSDLSSNVKFNSTDAEVRKYITGLVESKVNSALDVIRTRIDRFGVSQPNVQRIAGTGRIMVELPGVTDTERIKKLLQTSAQLEFWEVYSPQEGYTYFQTLNQKLANNTLKLAYSNGSNAIGSAKLTDTAAINKVLKNPKAQELLPMNMKYAKLLWAAKPDARTPNDLELYAIKGTKNNRAQLSRADLDASVTFDNFSRIQINMQMKKAEDADKWKTLTEKNIGHGIAVVMDDVVYTAPTVNSAIPNGQSVITGNFTLQEGNDLVDVLKSGKLPATAKVVQSEVVGPSLGQQSINNGLISFAISYIIILGWMIFYYGKAGLYANIALMLNLFYIIGIMASFGFVITLPGIAGIILTMGMSVDANIIIFERVKEELKLGKPLRQAFSDGQKHALSAIIDGNTTTIIVGVVLWVFGNGPIEGFAVALVVGNLITLFTSIFVAGLFVYHSIEKGENLALSTKITKNWFSNIHFKWMDKRKFAYTFSGILILISVYSIFTHGFDKGVDYTGGRTYVVKLDKNVTPEQASTDLETYFVENGKETNVEAKTYGDKNQLKITTKYGIDSEDANIDVLIKTKIYQGLKKYLPANYSRDNFVKGVPYGIQSSSEVGPTVADDIVYKGVMAVGISLVLIFIYILFRFRNWKMSLGAVISLFHDSMMVMGIFSILGWLKIVPFSVEIDQGFIASVLTIIGYSINDSVVVFDRIRENIGLHKKIGLKELYDNSINQTLGRTINTGASTIIATVIIFFFGGENLQGFMFALFIGFTFGMYSSIYIASALAYDATRLTSKQEELEVKPV